MHTQHESKVGKAMITKEQEIYRKWDPAGIEPAIHTSQKHLSPLNQTSNILITFLSVIQH